MIVGVDVGGTTVDAVAVDTGDGRVLARETRPTPVTGGPDLVAALCDIVATVQAAAGRGRLQAVGVAVPGLVDPHLGTVSHAVNLGIAAAPVALVEDLRTALGVPVTLDNDARAGAMAALAMLRGAGTAVDDVVYLNVGTGLAVGLVLGGRPHRGPLGHAGEIGHVPLPGSDVPCACGLRGCMEARIAGPAIVRRWPDGDGRSSGALFEAAASGDDRAVAIAREVTADIARLVHLVINLTGVGDVVLGGGVALAHPDLLHGVRAHLDGIGRRSDLAAVSLDPRRVVTAPADSAFGALGAVALAQRVLREPPLVPSPGTQGPGLPTPAPQTPSTTLVTDDAASRDDASAAPAGMHQGEAR